jgi:tetratricopeptide (TPR) repeat protein
MEKEISWEKADLLNTLGGIAWSQYEWEESENYYREGLKIGEALNHRRHIAWANGGLGTIARERGEYHEAKAFFWQMYENFRSIGYKNMAAHALISLGDLLIIMREGKEALKHYRKAFAIHEDIGKQDGIGFSIYGFGDVAFAMGNYEEAKEYYEEALELFRKGENQRFSAIGNLLCDLGRAAVEMGDEHEAQNKFVEALEIGIQNHFERSCLLVLVGLSALLIMNGDLERAVMFASLAVDHPKSRAWTREEARNHIEDLEPLLPPDDFNAAQEQGKALDLWITVEQLLTELKGELESHG